jgi:iron(III) transport system substrate-binding protein
VNLSGIGVVRGADQRAAAISLMKSLEGKHQQEVFVRNNKEFPVVSGVRPAPEIEKFGPFKRDPIDVRRAGAHLEEAVRLMNEVGWE